jgi:hypothetical protein
LDQEVHFISRQAPSDRDGRIVDLKVGYEEKQLQRLIKAVGGKWNPSKQFWKLPYSEAKQLGLAGRIVKHSGVVSNNRK